MEARQVFGSLGELHLSQGRATYCTDCGAKCEERIVAGLPRSICSRCGHIHWLNPMPAVSVLVADGDQVLLCKRSANSHLGGLWCMPCGFIERTEDFLTAGWREVLEETGVEVEITALLSVVSNFFTTGGHSFVAVLLARPIGGEPRPDDSETTEVAWFPHSELPSLAFEADLHIIQRYFSTAMQGAPVDPGFVRAGLTTQTPAAEASA